jgi:sugar phosphate isomerase/epimerase
VKHLDHQAVKLNLDLGVVYFLSEYRYIEKLIRDNISLIGHVHVSEPDLAPAPADVSMTATILRTLKQSGYRKWISLEMKEYSSNSIETLGESAKKLVDASNFVA